MSRNVSFELKFYIYDFILCWCLALKSLPQGFWVFQYPHLINATSRTICIMIPAETRFDNCKNCKVKDLEIGLVEHLAASAITWLSFDLHNK